MIFKLLFWFSAFAIFYIYAGYLLVLLVMAILAGKKKTIARESSEGELPHVTLFIAAWNELDFVEEKVRNSLQLNYPTDKLHHLWVTDGSDDGTPDALRKYPQLTVLHEDKRNGKIGAMNRGMKYVTTPIVVFCDANTYLNEDAVLEMVKIFSDPEVGCVAGEKRIFLSSKENASGAGEGIYWKFESFIKATESRLGSTVGAAGELFAIRTELFQEVEANTILDDFLISMRIIEKGFKVKYCPSAYAQEVSSATVSDELKRKIRIAAGGFQVIPRLKGLLNPFSYPWISFTYFSHKVLRWTSLPFLFIITLVSNVVLALTHPQVMYQLLLMFQVLFYLLSLVGYVKRNDELKMKIFFVPYYLNVMNYAVLKGLVRHLRGKQNVNWARAKRSGKLS